VITLGFKQAEVTRTRRGQPKLDLFLNMCQHVDAFMEEHDGRRFQAYFYRSGDGSLGLYLMTDAKAYDFDLSAKLAEFAAPYIVRGLLSSVNLLPASSQEELAALFDPNSALRIEMEHA
jgi:hypothetical protein